MYRVVSARPRISPAKWTVLCVCPAVLLQLQVHLSASHVWKAHLRPRMVVLRVVRVVSARPRISPAKWTVLCVCPAVLLQLQVNLSVSHVWKARLRPRMVVLRVVRVMSARPKLKLVKNSVISVRSVSFKTCLAKPTVAIALQGSIPSQRAPCPVLLVL